MKGCIIMEKTPKEMMRAYVDSQKFSSTTEIMDAMKEMFRDVLQQVMESELDTELGYEKSQRTSETAIENNRRNYRNGWPRFSKVNYSYSTSNNHLSFNSIA